MNLDTLRWIPFIVLLSPTASMFMACLLLLLLQHLGQTLPSRTFGFPVLKGSIWDMGHFVVGRGCERVGAQEQSWQPPLLHTLSRATIIMQSLANLPSERNTHTHIHTHTLTSTQISGLFTHCCLYKISAYARHVCLLAADNVPVILAMAPRGHGLVVPTLQCPVCGTVVYTWCWSVYLFRFPELIELPKQSVLCLTVSVSSVGGSLMPAVSRLYC